MNSNISRLVLTFSLVGLVNLQLLYDGHSDSLEYGVMQKLRKSLIDGENLQNQVAHVEQVVAQLNKEIQILKRRMDCPWGWVSYNTSCYRLFLSNESWSDAQIQCSKYGAVLAEITTAEENAFIVDNILRNDTIPDGVWAGGSDVRKEGNWRWWSTNTTMSFTNWRDDQPDNWNDSEHCLEVGKYWKWNDLRCDKKQEFLCETKAYY